MENITLRNINKYFGQDISRVHVLKDLSFSADPGEMVLILGPSGSGKSTFLTIAGGLQTPDSGSVFIGKEDLTKLSNKKKEELRLNKIGFILQAYNLVPYLTVKQQFDLVDRVKKTANMPREEFNQVIQKLDIGSIPDIILADEPTASLDAKRVKEVGGLLQDLAHQYQKTIIVVTHDIRLNDFADKIYHLDDGLLHLA